MLALTTAELATIVGVLIAGVLALLYRLFSDHTSLRERVARLEEAVRSLRNTSGKKEE